MNGGANIAGARKSGERPCVQHSRLQEAKKDGAELLSLLILLALRGTELRAANMDSQGALTPALSSPRRIFDRRERETGCVCWTRIAIRLVVLVGSLALVGRASAEGPQIYEQRWSDKALNERIDSNIEKYRKGALKIEVVDAAGKAVPNATVEVKQTGHEFLFGCNAFVLGQLKTPEANRTYEEEFARLFNFTTVPLYWAGTEPTQGELRYAEGGRDIWRRPPADRYLAFAKKYGITLKGHPLVWFAHNPDWLPQDPEKLRELFRKRMREIAERYADKMPIWDVVNESIVCEKKFPLYTPDKAYVAWSFREAAPLFPASATLMINEVNLSNYGTPATNKYYAQVKQLLADKVPVRGVGFQFHFMRRGELDTHLTNADGDPTRLYDLYDEFGKFGLPLFITEITIPSAGPDGEALQDEVVRNYYRLWFSVPAMRGITWWNLGDGTAVQGENEAEGGLVDGELKPKAAYHTLDKLINEEWKTKATVRTDAAGRAEARGFFGKYAVKVVAGGKEQTVEVDHASQGETVHRVTLAE